MKKQIRVFKFGGASLKHAAGVQNVGAILKEHREAPLCIIVSAMGKTTNHLERVVRAYCDSEGEPQAILEEIKQFHFGICAELFPQGHEVFELLNDLFVSVEWVLEDEPHENYDYNYDQIVSVGELLSSRIVAAYLEHIGLPTHWLDARDIIVTDDIFREGWVQWEATEERAERLLLPLMQQQSGFVLTQGFIGSTTENFTTTLGREGSDYTAAIFSHLLDAVSMTIWKDVPGVLTADPRYFENFLKLDRLSYKEAIEMTYYGAKVIHPKTIKPLQNKSIPLYVKSFLEPHAEGTVISDAMEHDTYPPMVAVERDQVLVHISTRDFSFVAEHHISQLFQYIADLRLQVNMMQNTAISFSVCFNDVDDKVDRFCKLIESEFKVVLDRGLELITIRHYRPEVIENLRSGKIVLLEERLPRTIQMVTKEMPVLQRREVPQLS